MDFLSLIILLWIILIISYFASATLFFILKLKSKDNKERQKIMLLVCFIFLFIALSRLIHLLIIFKHGSLFKKDISLEDNFIFQFSPLLFDIGVTTIVYSFEKRLQNFEKKYLTILLLVLTSLHFTFVYISMFNPNDQNLVLTSDTMSWVKNIAFACIFLPLALNYLRISLKTSGEVMKKALFIFIGFILLIASYSVAGLEEFGTTREIIGLLTGIFGIASVPFIIYGYK